MKNFKEFIIESFFGNKVQKIYDEIKDLNLQKEKADENTRRIIDKRIIELEDKINTMANN